MINEPMIYSAEFNLAPLVNILTVSWENVENVVKLPIKPVKIIASVFGENICFINDTSPRKPMKKQPSKFAIRVPAGKFHNCEISFATIAKPNLDIAPKDAPKEMQASLISI